MSARSLTRAAVVALSTLSALALSTSPAGAAPGLTIPLDPPQVGVYLVPVENEADPEDIEADPDGDWYAPVEVAWGGAVVVQLPPGLDGPATSWALDTGSTLDDEPTRSLSTGADGADHLDVTDLGDGAHRVDLPADPAGGPVGLLTVDGLTGSDDGIEAIGPLYYLLEFTGSGSPLVTVRPQLSVLSSVPCGFDLLGAPDDCPAYPVTAGDTVGLTVPDGSLLRSLGFGELDDAVVGLSSLDFDGDYDEEYDEDYDRGYSAGYDDGYAETYGEGYGDGYLASYGVGYSEEGKGADAGYADGRADGRADGSADARHPAPGPTPAEAMSRVAAVAAAVDQASDEASDEAGDGDAASAAQEPAPRVAPAAAEQESGTITETESFWLAADGLLPLSPTPSGATVTLPADLEAGTYELVVLEGLDVAGPSSTVMLTLEVAAAPVVGGTAGQAAAAPVLNRGLSSQTGVTDAAAPQDRSPLVALGGGAVLAAGLGAAVLLRPRRRPAED